jgi:hypothetical protein
MLDVEGGFGAGAPVGLARPFRDGGRQLRGGVADVDLPAGDVVRPAVERDRP